MKKLTFVFIAMAILFLMAMPFAMLALPAHASDSGACYSIADGDARSYCIAKAKRDVSACYSIQRADLRSQCLAEVR